MEERKSSILLLFFREFREPLILAHQHTSRGSYEKAQSVIDEVLDRMERLTP